VAGARRRAGQGAARRRGDRPEPHRQSEKGAKKSVLCDAAGIPLGVATAGANLHDQKLVEQTIAQVPIERPKPTSKAPQHLCLDKGYDAPPTWELVERLGFIPHIRSRGEEREQKRRQPDARARRWVVEGTHSWLNRNRSILTRWCKKPDNNRALLHLACGLICWRRALAAPLPG
jgi:putative transposase